MSQMGKSRCDPGDGEEDSRERGETEGRVGKGDGRGPVEDQRGHLLLTAAPLLLSEQDAGTLCQGLTWGSKLG